MAAFGDLHRSIIIYRTHHPLYQLFQGKPGFNLLIFGNGWGGGRRGGD